MHKKINQNSLIAIMYPSLRKKNGYNNNKIRHFNTDV